MLQVALSSYGSRGGGGACLKLPTIGGGEEGRDLLMYMLPVSVPHLLCSTPGYSRAQLGAMHCGCCGAIGHQGAKMRGGRKGGGDQGPK